MSRSPYPPLANPWAGNPLRTRLDVQRATTDLLDPLVPHLSDGGARVTLGSAGAGFGVAAQELEGWARPLWGLVPLLAGGGTWEHAPRWLAGLDAGTDPDHPDYWGPVTMVGQRMVEMAAIGFALAWTPHLVWDPLSPAARDRVVRWLQGILEHDPVDSNWQFFRVMVSLGLDTVGVAHDHAPVEASLATLDGFHLGDGWYVDGSNGTVDHYVPMAFHLYGLLYASSPHGAPRWGDVFRERAVAFAQDLQHWFDPDGGVVPFGRSLTYRPALGAFWGALVLADLEALPWATVRGLWLRHLRWWSGWPVSDRDGVLSVGYGYGSDLLAEDYNSPGSPYWACKWFLGLAAADDHPIWHTEEAALPPQEQPSSQPAARMVLTRDETQVVALSGGGTIPPFPHAEAKYARFAYSSVAGFAGRVPTRFGDPADSTLTLTDEDGVRASRTEPEQVQVEDGCVWCRWQPFPDVTVETVLWGRTPWHVRLHRVRTPRPLVALESGFCIPWGGWDDTTDPVRSRTQAGRVEVAWRDHRGVLVDLDGQATAEVALVAPNANVLHPRTLLPALRRTVQPGTSILRVAVMTTDRGDRVSVDDVPAPPAEMVRLLEQGPRDPS